MNKKVRLARLDEKSSLLKRKGYRSETCSGKCLIHSRLSDNFWNRVYDITHKCERVDEPGRRRPAKTPCA